MRFDSRLHGWLFGSLALVLLALGLGNAPSRAPARASEKTIETAGDNGRAHAMFGGTPARNMANAIDKDLPDGWSVEEGKEKNVRWKAKTGTRGYNAPIVAGGKIFVSTNNGEPRDPKIEGDKAVLECFRESDGQFLWQLVHDMPPNDVTQGGQANGDGLLSAPVVENELLYYVTPAAEVVCADVTGKVRWRSDLMKQLKVFPCFVNACSPLLVGDLLFVVTGNGKDAEDKLRSPQAPSFVALDKKTGEVKWQNDAPGDRILQGQWGNPSYAEVNGKGQVIFPGGDGWLYGLEPATGKLLWKFDCNPKASVYKTDGGRSTRNYIVATPVVHDNKVYVGVGQQPDLGGGVGHFWCVDVTKTGDLSPVDDNFDPQAAVNKNSGLVWHFGGPTGKKTGKKHFFARTASTCAIHDGLLYIADVEGYVYCLDASTGQKYWEHDLKIDIWASPYYADGKIYLGTVNGEVYVYPAGKELKEANVHTIDMGQPVHATVTAANGTLYVQTDNALYALKKK